MILLFILGLGIGLWLYSIIANYRKAYREVTTEKKYWQNRCITAEKYILILEIPPPDKKETELAKKVWEESTKRL